MSRIITDLKEAAPLDGWPSSIPRPRSRGVKALGRRYEAAVARQLGSEATHGQWWTFRDANGQGLCQTDLFMQGRTWAVIIECKHTWVPEGMEQLQYLYLPVVGMATGKRALGIQVCKHLVPYHTGPVFQDLETAIENAKEIWRHGRSKCITVHWRGIGPIVHSNVNSQKEVNYGQAYYTSR